MSKKLILLLIFSIALSANIYSQLDSYSKQTSLDGISDTWHLVRLPAETFPYLRSDMGDVRVYGIAASGDTIEAPYIMYRRDEQKKQVYIGHKQINTSNNENGYYYTWVVDDPGILSEILLDFEKENYDWKVKLEGSADQNEWFSILDDYRVLSIKNENTDYTYNRLIFPTCQYKYYRLLVKTNTDPKMKAAKTIQEVKKEGIFDNHTIIRQDVVVDKAKKQTIVDITLEHAASLSELEMAVENDFDYYRPIKIQYLADSVKTERGYSYQYRTLQRGTLSSVAPNVFNLKNTICRVIRVIVSDGDNQSLKFKDSKVKGSAYEMAVRFSEPAEYVLAYGSPNATRPNYDIQQFAKTIPDDIKNVTVGKTQEIAISDKEEVEPLIKNKMWLWLVMGLVILLLGWFSISMISKKQ